MNRRSAPIALALAFLAAPALAGCGGGEGPAEPSNRPPEVSIDAPSTGASFEEGEAVAFEGSATDPEDGSVTGGALVWSSDVDGQLGTGTSVTVSSLATGDHAVTLEATDSDGATDSAQISVAVTSDAPSDQVELRAGPLAALPGGLLVDQTVDVAARIRNVGGEDAGGFDWRITVDGVTEASGRVDGLAAGDSTELPRAEALGPFGTGNHTVRLEVDTGDEVDEGSEADNEAEERFAVYPRGMDVELRFLTDVSDEDSASFRDAADRWETVIPGDLRDVAVDSFDTSQCIEGGPVLDDETLDDLLVLVRIDSIDGPGNVLARAGPCGIRQTFPENIAVGVLEADSADIESERDAGRLGELLVHELAHVLGFGTLWRERALVADTATDQPFFTGRQAREAFSEVGGGAFDGQPVPVESFGGQGTALGHWPEASLQHELMTGFINEGDNPLSIVSVGSMGDLDLPTDPSAADAYDFPGAAAAGLRSGLGPPSGWERRVPAPLFGIDPATGSVELLRPVRRP